MPLSFSDIVAASGAAVLSDAEKLYVRATLLVFESTATQPIRADLDLAFDALDEAGIQSLRAHIELYVGGQTVIDGGVDAISYQPVLERWSIRNGVRSLLSDTGLVSLAQEPMPGTGDSLQLISIGLGSFGSCNEFSQ